MSQVIRQGLEKLVVFGTNAMKDTITFSFGRSGPYGGIKFDLPDESFDEQPAASVLPKAIVVPFESIIQISIAGLNDSNKDLLISMLAEACSERIEHFINQVCIQRIIQHITFHSQLK